MPRNGATGDQHMSEDAGAAASGAQDGAAPQGQNGGGNGAPEGSQGSTGAHSPTPGVDDRSAESLLADAVGTDSSDGEEATGKDELAAAKTELAKWKKMSRENEKLARQNADKAKNYDAYTESQKTEQQKLADRAAEAEKRASEAEGRYHRTLAAATYDLPPSMIDQLGSGTEEEITQRAEMFAAAINEKAAILAAAQAQANGQQAQRPANGFQRPVESLRPGALPASDNKPRDSNQWFREVFAARK